MNSFQVLQLTHKELAEIVSNVISERFNELKSILSDNISKRDEEEYLTRKSASCFLNVSLTTINQWQKQGIITRYKLGNKNFYKKSELLSKISESNTTNN